MALYGFEKFQSDALGIEEITASVTQHLDRAAVPVDPVFVGDVAALAYGHVNSIGGGVPESNRCASRNLGIWQADGSRLL